jgi:hypothetical protein
LRSSRAAGDDPADALFVRSIFGLQHLPGDPAKVLAGEERIGRRRAPAREDELDKPIPVQYSRLGGVFAAISASRCDPEPVTRSSPKAAVTIELACIAS